MAFTLRPDVEQQARWQSAADADGRSLANWISRVCDQAAQDLEGVGVDLDRLGGTSGRDDVGGGEDSAGGRVRPDPHSAAAGLGEDVPAAAPTLPPELPRRRLKRTERCEHRVPATSFCKVCDG